MQAGRQSYCRAMASNAQPSDNGFRRQVTFRIGPEDAPLLEVAARANGGIQAGIVAALRAYTAGRLQPAESEPEREPQKDTPTIEPTLPPAPRPTVPLAGTMVELNIAEAAALLGLSATTLRERIKRGTHPGRVGSNGLYLADISLAELKESGIELSPRGTAEVLGLKPSTIKKRCKEGRYPNARHDGLAWTIPVADVL